MPIRFHIRPLLAILAAAAATFLAASCSSGDKAGDSPDSGNDEAKLASRIASKPSLDKRSQFEPTEDSDDKKSFKAGAFSSKEYKGKEFSGSKSFKTKSYSEGDNRSPWAGLTSRESAQEVSSDLNSSFSTGESNFSGRESRDSGSTFGTSSYKTGDNITGSKALEDASPPKIIPNESTKRGMSESEIQSLLGKE